MILLPASCLKNVHQIPLFNQAVCSRPHPNIAGVTLPWLSYFQVSFYYHIIPPAILSWHPTFSSLQIANFPLTCLV